jgi:CubicO group peptidase (beta-lactamase class C family)
MTEGRYSTRFLAVIISLSLATTATATAHASERLTPAKIASIDSAVTAAIARNHIPGLAIAIVIDRQIRWQRAYGLVDVENAIPAETSTVFRIASVTKPLTATAALQLAERGKLDLDAPVQKYAPSFPVKAQPITPRQVLGHLAGIRNYKAGEGERTTHYDSLATALEIFKDDALVREPGAEFGYTTFGYTLLGVVIEGASGMRYTDYMRANVFEPAGMAHTQADDPSVLVPRRARGYSPKVYGVFDGQWRNATLMDASYKLPAGGMLSTVGDLARFAIALQGGALLKKSSLELAFQSQKTRAGAETGYGYGWYIRKRTGSRPGKVVEHGGVQPGCSSELWMLPEQRFAVVILTNLEGGGRLGLIPLSDDIAEIVLQ